MSKVRVAVVGLGRVGSVFLDALLKQHGRAVDLVAVAESSADAPGCAAARNAGIPILTAAELLQRSSGLDIIFDVTGSEAVRRELREGLAAAHNRDTVIASESVARLVWSLMVPGGELPEVHGRAGY
jgi:glyceraldehyde-3-phosphate dehydrogenase/erythrose-4-phosphate dehydrogenase